jgi:hypothetical protein
MKEIDPHWPINKQAKIVVSKTSVRTADFYCNDTIASMAPLPMRPFNGIPEHDLTGKKVGRFVVIGYALFKYRAKRKDGGCGRWVVKCQCGRYQMLSAKAIKKTHEFMACVECNKTHKLRRNNGQALIGVDRRA